MRYWSYSWILLLPLLSGMSEANELEQRIQKAGNASSDTARLFELRKLLKLPTLSQKRRKEVDQFCNEIQRFLTSNDLAYFGNSILKTGDYEFGIAEQSPLYPLTHLYRGRMLIWATMEYGGYWSLPEERRTQLNKVRLEFEKSHAAFPEEPLARMYLGEPLPPNTDYQSKSGAPAWASAQREALERLTDIVHWWIDHRLQETGQFGGGWGDDCEMWRWWAPLLIGFEDPKINAAQERFSDALLSQPHMQGGYTTQLYDVEHTSEDSSDAMTPMLHLRPRSKLWKSRALRLAELMKSVWAGENQRGQLQFKSTYFSVDQVDESPQRACDTVYHPRAVQPALLLWQRNRDPALTELFSAWMDTWVDAAARAERGKPAGVIPSAIHWPDGGVGGVGEFWWDPENHGRDPLYVFPSEMHQMTHTLLLAHHITGKEDYLAPIRSMAAMRLKHQSRPPVDLPTPGTEAWCAMKMGNLSSVLSKYRLLTGSKEFDALLMADASEYVQYRLHGKSENLVRALSQTAEALRTNIAGYTSEVRYTDRVLTLPRFLGRDGINPDATERIYAPDTDLLYATVTGDPGVAGYLPLNAVRWLTEPRSLAALVTNSGPDRLEARLFHFGDAARTMTAEFYLLEPGRYKISLNGEQHAFHATQECARWTFSLPAQKETQLSIKRTDN